MMHRPSKLNVLLAATALLAVTPLAARAQSASQLLGSMMHAERTAAYTATQVIRRDGHDAEVVRIWRDGRRQRMEWERPSVRRGDLLVDDGANIWLYHRQENAATQTKSSPRNSRQATLMQGFALKALSVKVIGGRRTRGLELKPRDIARSTRRYWIDLATGVVLLRERIPAAEGSPESSELRNLHFGPVEASRFAWSPPAGTKITHTSGSLYMQIAAAKRSAPWLQSPQSLPAGYAFESAVVDSKKGEAWLRYSTGTRRFSIFQQRADGNYTRAPQAVNGGLYWQRGGSRFLILGVASDAAGRIAGSVR